MNRTQRNTLADLILAALRERAARDALQALAEILAAPSAVRIDRGAASVLTARDIVVSGGGDDDASVVDAGDLVWCRPTPAFAAVRDAAHERVRRALAASTAYAPPPHGVVADPTDPPDLPAVLRRAAALFDAGLYFEVHEELEPAWGRARGETRTILQGIIQVAVALHHAAHGNDAGARRLLAEGRAKLEPHRGAWRGLALDALLEDVACFAASGFGGGDAATPPRLRIV